MKLVLTLDDFNYLDELKTLSSNIIIPTKFSNYSKTIYDEDSILEMLANHKDTTFYALINQIFMEEELEDIRNFIYKFARKRLKYVFADLAVYEILKEFNITNKGVYFPNTLICNYMDLPFWSNLGIYGLSPSLEIPLKDVSIIGKNKTLKLFYQAFGYSPMFQSKRKILTNFKEYKKLDYNPKDTNFYLIEETRDDKYFVLENNHQSTIFQAGIHSALEGLNIILSDIDFLFLDGRFIDNELYLKAAKIFLDASFDLANLSDYDQELKMLIPNITGDFLYNDSVFKKEEF